MKRWTYKVLNLRESTLMTKLEEYGNDGWEAFAIDSNNRSAEYYTVYLKREKAEDEE